MSEKAVIGQIDFSKSEQYTLSIRLSTDGFSFSIYNPILENSLSFIPQTIKPALSMAANVKEILKEAEVMQYTYKCINVLQVSKRFTLIPIELFEEEQGDSFFYHNHPKLENEQILYNTLRKANVAVAFSIDKSSYQQIEEHFPSVRFYSQASPLIEHFAGKCRLGNSKKMYTYIRKNSLDVFCYDRGRLLLANSFSGQQIEDRIYYLLYIWKQLNYNQERDELHLVGMLENKEELTTELKKYIRQVFIINPKAELNYPNQTHINNIPFDLQVLSLSEF